MKRLDAIFSQLEHSKIFADVGCDHGKLCLMVHNARLADRIIASDISAPSLNKAKQLMGDNAEYVCGDGIDAIYKQLNVLPDVAVISGMGGYTVTDVIGDYKINTLVLMPHNCVGHVREFLVNKGYSIISDFTIKESKKFYDVIKAVPGKCEIDRLQTEYGVNYKNGSDAFYERLNIELNKVRSYPNTDENKQKIIDIMEVLSWQK